MGAEPSSSASQVGWRVGRFEDPALEAAFERDYFERSHTTVRVSLALALILYALFGFLDPFITSEATDLIWIVRFGIGCPILIATFLYTFTKGFERHLQTAPFVGVLFAGITIIVITVLASEAGASVYYAGMLLCFAWIHGLSRLSFRNATILSVVLLVLYEVTALLVGHTPGPALLSNTFFVVSANIIGMFVSYNVEASFRRDFLQRRLLDARRLELEDSVEKLHDAERRVADLRHGVSQALEDVPQWTEQIADDIRGAIVAAEVRVWRIEGDDVQPLNHGLSPAPSAEAIRAGHEAHTDPRGRVLVQVTGISGECFGAVVVTAPSSWDEPERRVVGGFARQLGGALEILRMRGELKEAEARREAARQRMRERGVGTLHLCNTCGRCYDESHERCEFDGSTLIQRVLPFRIQDRYQLVRLIGQGGMGQVFLASDEKLLRQVAIKVLHHDRMLDPEVRRQLRREAQVVARIGHVGVVEVYDLGDLEDGSAFLVMEMLVGCSLADQIAEHGRGTPRQVARLLRRTSSALAAAHRMGVVHRDLKPQNIFLLPGDKGFLVKILDFGLARMGGVDATTISGEGGLFGTPAYMAPEQVRGSGVGSKADVYALGSVIFEALTGQRVVRPRQTIAATLMSVVNDPAPAVSSILPAALGHVDHLFNRALTKDPDERGEVEPWATELADALESMTADYPGWPEPIGGVAPSLAAEAEERTVLNVATAADRYPS